jgi:hypothetical protein
MKPPILTADELIGIREKLTRADETVANLNSEITTFLKAAPEGGFSQHKHEAAKQWADFHAKHPLPRRFGVIAGEIVHHLRSSLDHIVWNLSSETYRRQHERDIGFPILTDPPDTKEKQRNYERRLAGITSTAALRLIEELQPYKAQNPLDNPLAIVHQLDRIDKHQNLVLVIASFDAVMHVPMALFSQTLLGPFAGGLEKIRDADQKVQIKVSRQVAFAKFGGRKNQPVIPALTYLVNAIGDVINRFG